MFRILVYFVNVSSLNLSLEPDWVQTKQLHPNWWVGLTHSHVLFDLCGAYSTCLTCYSQTVSQSEPHTQVFPESEAAWRVVGWAKGTKTKEKRWMVWVRRWKRAWWTIHYLESLLSGGCHWPYKFMIWKTGKRRHAVMDGMMVNKGVHTDLSFICN